MGYGFVRRELFPVVLVALAACNGIREISPSSGLPGDLVLVETQRPCFERNMRRSPIRIASREARVAEVLSPTQARILVPSVAAGPTRAILEGSFGLGSKSFTVGDPRQHSSLEAVLRTPAGKLLSSAQVDALRALAAASEASLRLQVNPVLGNPVWIQLRLRVAPGSDVAASVAGFLDRHGGVFRLPPGGRLVAAGPPRAVPGGSAVRVALRIGAFGAFSSGIEVVRDDRGWISEVTGLVPSRLDPAEAGAITEDEARARLRSRVPDAERATLAGTRCLLAPALLPQLDRSSLAWHFAHPEDQPGILRHWFVDTSTGELVATTSSRMRALAPGVSVSDCMADLSRPTYHVSAKTGARLHVSWQHVGGLRDSVSPNASAREAVLAFLAAWPEIFGDGDPARHQRVIAELPTDAFGMRRVRTQQRYGGLPVFGAGLRAEIGPDGEIWSVLGHHVAGLRVDVRPAFGPDGAVQRAVAARARATCRGCGEAELSSRAAALAAAAGSPELGIFPTRLARPAVQRGGKAAVPETVLPSGVLAYRVPFQDSVSFVDAAGGRILYHFPLAASQNEVKVYDAGGATVDVFGDLFAANAPEVDPAHSTDPDVPIAFQSATRTLDYWYGRHELFPYLFLDNMMDNGGDDLHLVVDAVSPDLQCLNAANVPGIPYLRPDRLFFCRPDPTTGSSIVVDDVVAHEMTHGVTHHTAGLIGADESGALNEYFSDLFGELVFPDPGGTWMAAGGTPHARDMAKPTIDHLSKYAYPSADCVGKYPDCDSGWIHLNLGIPSRAAVLLTDGIPGAEPGIGRDKMAALSFATLVEDLGPWSGFDDLAIGLADKCVEWLQWGKSNNISGSLTRDDCDRVPRAFQQVGISPAASSGWIHTSGFFGATGDVVRTGPTYLGGCTLDGYVLKVQDLGQRGMRIACSREDLRPDCAGNAGTEIDHAGEFGVRITSWSQGSDRAEARVHWWRSNFEDLAWDLEFVPKVPPGRTLAACEGENVIQRRSDIARHWSGFGLGGKGDESIRPAPDMPAGCTVTGVSLVKVDQDGQPIGYPGVEVGDASSGARLEQSPEGTNSLQAQVHWWFDGFNIVRYQVAYTIAQPAGVGCWP